MGLFDIFKKKDNTNDTWVTYLDKAGDKELSVRVDTKYVGVNYKNTFYIQVKYSAQEVNYLPDREFLKKIAVLEETILESLKNIFQDKIVFLGTATFGGSSYITFASDLSIRWEEYIKSEINENLTAGVYQNDNMGYYNKILYPEFLRK